VSERCTGATLRKLRQEACSLETSISNSRTAPSPRTPIFAVQTLRKLAAIASALIPASSGEQTSANGPVQLCPDCRGVLTERQYSCAGCGLSFKNEKTMVLRSILLPGGGYFYTGHPLIAILPALVETIFIVEILLILFAGLASPKAVPDLFAGLLGLGIFWALETAVTILHCRRYVRDFIPEKRDPTRSPQGAIAKIGV